MQYVDVRSRNASNIQTLKNIFNRATKFSKRTFVVQYMRAILK